MRWNGLALRVYDLNMTLRDRVRKLKDFIRNAILASSLFSLVIRRDPNFNSRQVN